MDKIPYDCALFAYHKINFNFQSETKEEETSGRFLFILVDKFRKPPTTQTTILYHKISKCVYHRFAKVCPSHIDVSWQIANKCSNKIHVYIEFCAWRTKAGNVIGKKRKSNCGRPCWQLLARATRKRQK